jgi:hypothetical protein
MCLDRLLDEKPEKEGTGWKGFLIGRSHQLTGMYCSTTQVRPRGKWLREEDFRYNPRHKTLVCSNQGQGYPTGWHIYVKRPRFGPDGSFCNLWSNEKMVKVKYRRATVKGYQDGRLVVIAKEMRIEE